jgi:hypothetical protein
MQIFMGTSYGLRRGRPAGSFPGERMDKPRRRKKKRELPVIGWREWVALPDQGVESIKVKVDTGARTSSLHAFELETYRRGTREYVRFEVHPEQRSAKHAVAVRAPIHEWRRVKSSSGHTEHRPVILATIELLGVRWQAELTLTRRDDMGFRMLLGRQAIRGRFVVDAGKSFRNGRRIRATRRLKKPK